MKHRLLIYKKLQNHAARIITGASYLQRSSDVLCELGWMTSEAMRKRQKAILMFKILNGLTPPYLSEIFTHSASLHDLWTAIFQNESCTP